MEVARPIVGVLGGICAGKSYVAGRIAALGPGRVVDADALAHEALEAFARDGSLVEILGEGVLGDGGRPDRREIAKRCFADATLLRRLERLIHPPVHTAIRMAIDDHRSGMGPTVLVLDVPLLIEVGLDRACDALWFVQVPDSVQVARGRARGMAAEEIARRAAFQSPLERKRARADFLVENVDSPESLDGRILEGLALLGISVPVATRVPTPGSLAP